MVSHEIWLAGHMGGEAGEKGVVEGVTGVDPGEPEEPDASPEAGAGEEPLLLSPGPLFAIAMLTAG